MPATRMTAPIVTIVIPTYNRAHLLPRAVASVRAQTCADWELILVDDGSTDSTLADVTAMAAADQRIRLAVNTGRRGPSGARNAGIAAARAPWVAFLDSDDSWEAEKLARFMAEARAHPEAVLIGSDYWMVDPGKRGWRRIVFRLENGVPDKLALMTLYESHHAAPPKISAFPPSCAGLLAV
jgi:glycosyltransferase involved in cell wall biosynthesis